MSNRQTRFWNMLARRYSRQPVADEAAYRTKLEKTRAHFSPDTEVLEIGCGTGTTAVLHAPSVRHIRATDFSDRMIQIARARAAEAGVTNVDFKVVAIDEIDPDAHSYDVVMAMSVLHLLDNRTEVIGRVARLLRPGGVFVSSTTCLGGKHGMLRAILRVARPLGLLPTVNFFTADQLVAELQSAGLTVEERWQPGPDAAVFIVARRT